MEVHVGGETSSGLTTGSRDDWRPHTTRPNILVRQTRDGQDYARVCHEHAWMSLAAESYGLPTECPECEAEHDDGHERYRRAMRSR